VFIFTNFAGRRRREREREQGKEEEWREGREEEDNWPAEKTKRFFFFFC
jgi:hypothetical protein